MRRYSKSLWSYNPIPYGCVLYLPLWSPGLNGSRFKSVDPFGHTCTVIGALLKAKGRDFDGINDVIDIADTYSSNTGAIRIWFKVDTDEAEQVRLWAISRNADATLSELVLTLEQRLDKASGLQCTLYVDNVLQFNILEPRGTFNPTTNLTWHMLTIAQNGTTAYMYLDGSDITTFVGGDADVSAWLNDVYGATAPADSCLLGAVRRNSALSGHFGGKIGEVWIYDVFQSAAVDLYVYNRTKGRYL